MAPRRCPVCHAPLTVLCMTCRGKVGGAASSPAKREATTRNLEKARAAKARRRSTP